MSFHHFPFPTTGQNYNREKPCLSSCLHHCQRFSLLTLSIPKAFIPDIQKNADINLVCPALDRDRQTDIDRQTVANTNLVHPTLDTDRQTDISWYKPCPSCPRHCCSFFSTFCCRRRFITASGLEMLRVKRVSGMSVYSCSAALPTSAAIFFSFSFFFCSFFSRLDSFLLNVPTWFSFSIGALARAWASVVSPQIMVRIQVKWTSTKN